MENAKMLILVPVKMHQIKLNALKILVIRTSVCILMEHAYHNLKLLHLNAISIFLSIIAIVNNFQIAFMVLTIIAEILNQ